MCENIRGFLTEESFQFHNDRWGFVFLTRTLKVHCCCKFFFGGEEYACLQSKLRFEIADTQCCSFFWLNHPDWRGRPERWRKRRKKEGGERNLGNTEKTQRPSPGLRLASLSTTPAEASMLSKHALRTRAFCMKYAFSAKKVLLKLSR